MFYVKAFYLIYVAGFNLILDILVNKFASRTVTRHFIGLMANVLHAFAESTSGSLDLREMNIGQDDAVCAAIEVLQPNLLELYLDGNSLPTSFIDLISKILRHLTLLNLSCCSLKRYV